MCLCVKWLHYDTLTKRAQACLWKRTRDATAGTDLPLWNIAHVPDRLNSAKTSQFDSDNQRDCNIFPIQLNHLETQPQLPLQH